MRSFHRDQVASQRAPSGKKGGSSNALSVNKGEMRVVKMHLVMVGSRGGDKRELLKLTYSLSPTSYFFISLLKLSTMAKLASISFLCAVTNLANLLHLVSRVKEVNTIV